VVLIQPHMNSESPCFLPLCFLPCITPLHILCYGLFLLKPRGPGPVPTGIHLALGVHPPVAVCQKIVISGRVSHLESLNQPNLAGPHTPIKTYSVLDELWESARIGSQIQAQTWVIPLPICRRGQKKHTSYGSLYPIIIRGNPKETVVPASNWA